ncbi:multiple sugar transport system substrate-binding protein [Pararobbsia alpina]|uniref:ABC transporter substrate-binding protein n=1 Tax=Pararobbsia alpina TaxID=621374 RepID=UPI0039A65CF9
MGISNSAHRYVSSASLSTCLKRFGAALTLAPLFALMPLQAQAKDPVKLQFWDMIWGPPSYIDAAKNLVTDFNKAHPDIQVEYRSVPWNNWYQTYLTAIGSGSAPDISTGAGYQAVQFYDQGAIRPLDDLVAEMKASGDDKDFLPNTLETLKYNGHYVALPWGIDIRVWYYRKDLLQAANQKVPTNWSELRAVAKAVTGKGKYGLVSSGDTGGSHYLYTAMLNNGGALFTPDRKLTLTSDRNMEAWRFYEGMVKDGSVSPASAGYTADDARAAFYRGESAFYLDSPGDIASAGAAASQIGIVPPLAGPHGDKGTIYWVNNIMVYKQTKHPDEVKTFLKWWSHNEKALWTAGGTRQLPVRKSFASDPYFTNSAELSEVIRDYVPIGKTTATKAPGIFPALNDVEGEGAFQTMTQQLWQGKPLDQITGAAQSRLSQLVPENGK